MLKLINDLKKTKQYWNWPRIRSNLRYLIKNDILEERYLLKDETIEDCVYEFDELRESLIRLKIANEVQSVQILAEAPKSFARYGDGEVSVMRGEDSAFQQYDPLLAQKMKDILIRKRDNLYVGLNSSYFQSPTKYSKRNRKFYRLYGTSYRRYFNEICDPDNFYLDACCLCGYFRQGDSFDIDTHFKNVRNLFKGKRITIVCGKGILDKLTYNLFDLAQSIEYIDAPKCNAFSEYDYILKNIQQNVEKDRLVCIILGMTATVLAADLADSGYIAWDIGHAAKDYDAYMKRVEKTDAVIDKFFAPD